MVKQLEYYENTGDDNYRYKIVVIDGDVDSGIECVFVPTSTTEGLKLYPSRDAGEVARHCQDEAAGHGLAPQVYSTDIFEIVLPLSCYKISEAFCLRFSSNGKAYVFRTQRAKPMTCNHTPGGTPIGEQVTIKLRALQQACAEKLSFKMRDLHYRNIGWIDERMVAIDFGECSHNISNMTELTKLTKPKPKPEPEPEPEPKPASKGSFDIQELQEKMLHERILHEMIKVHVLPHFLPIPEGGAMPRQRFQFHITY